MNDCDDNPFLITPITDPYGHEVDLWSLGCTLYNLLTLRAPFEDYDDDVFLGRTLSGRYPRHRIEHLDPAIVELVDGLLQPDPAKRYKIADIKANKWCCDLFAQRQKELEARRSADLKK